MKRVTVIAALLALIAPLAALADSKPGAERPAYNFSPVNQYGLQVTAEFWNPIIEHVSERSGVQLRLKLGRTSADTTSYVIAQEVDFAFTNHLFSPERMQMGWKVFGRRNAPPVRGHIVVPHDSPIKSLRDLAGKTVGFPGPEAFLAYKVPYANLLREEVPTTVVFGGNMDGAFAQLTSGRVHAVGANSQLTEGYAQRENKNFRELWSSRPFHDLALMASPRVPQPQLQAVARAFLTMHTLPEGRAVLARASNVVKLAQPAEFVAASYADYASYRDFYATAPIGLR